MVLVWCGKLLKVMVGNGLIVYQSGEVSFQEKFFQNLLGFMLNLFRCY